MKKKVIIHPAFHKTATTTVQDFFEINRDYFEKNGVLFRSRGNPEMMEIINERCRGRDSSGEKFKEYLSGIAQEWRDDERYSHFIFSHEDLIGRAPTRLRLDSYTYAVSNLEIIHNVFKAHSDVMDHIFYVSTRAQDKWEESLFWHLFSYSGLEITFEEFHEKIGKKNNLETYIKAFRELLGDDYLQVEKLEDQKEKFFGPVEPILDILRQDGKSIEGLQPIENRNVRPPEEVLDAMKMIKFDDTLSKEEKKAATEELGAILAVLKLR